MASKLPEISALKPPAPLMVNQEPAAPVSFSAVPRASHRGRGGWQ